MKKGFPTKLTWVFFVLAIGALVSAGIYLEKSIAESFAIANVVKTLIFMVLGILFVIMFGQGRAMSCLDMTEQNE
jgi:hypothetical protein